MSERDINRWQETITPRDKAPQPWTIGSGGSWDMTEVQPIPDAMLAELAQRYQYAGTPWNCRSMPLSDSAREYMYLLYYSMQGLVARLRRAEAERDDIAQQLVQAEIGKRKLDAECDALRAKIAAMENQEPVAFGLYSGWALKATYLKEHEACEQRDRRQLTADLSGSLEAYRVVPLYTSPGAKGE